MRIYERSVRRRVLSGFCDVLRGEPAVLYHGGEGRGIPGDGERHYTAGDDSGGEEGRYQLINDIALAKSLQDYDTMDELLEEYYKKDFLNSRLFGLR